MAAGGSCATIAPSGRAAETGEIVEKVAGTVMVFGLACEWASDAAFDRVQTSEKEG